MTTDIGDSIIDLFEEYGIEYVTHGQESNVTRGNINVQCPFCTDDPSHHMGIDLKSGKYNCWRSSTHKGRSPERLIAKLLGVSVGQVESMLGTRHIDETDIERVASGQIFNEEKIEDRASRSNVLDPMTDARAKELFRLKKIRHDVLTNKFFLHLKIKRGFEQHTKRVVNTFGLRCAVSGYFKNRIVIPVFNDDGLIVAMTSRSIMSSTQLRYKALPESEPSRECSMLSPSPIKSLVYNAHRAREGGAVLVVNEGAFDVMKVDFFGEPYGVRSVGLFNMTPTEDQAEILLRLSSEFDQVVFCLDRNYEYQTFETSSLVLTNCPSRMNFDFPPGVNDPGDLTPKQAQIFCKRLLEEK